jgi:y4mF family transcriptional regulator
MNRVRTAAELGAMLRTRRKAKGLTQVELADLAGVSQRFISELERGRESTGLALVLRVCSRLALDVFVDVRERSV